MIPEPPLRDLNSETRSPKVKLALDDVSVVYRNPTTKKATVALLEISLEIREGEFISLIGASGCGKSTLLNCISGLTRPLGNITLNGLPVSGPGPDRVMVFQSSALFPWRNVLENVLYGLELKRIRASEARSRALDVLRLVGLDPSVHNHYPHELSGGMQQRVNLARALVMSPEVLLLDEPFASLDAQTRELMQVELLRIWQAARNTSIFVTHQISEAIYLADRVVVLTASPGRIREVIQVGLPRPRPLQIKRDPRFIELEGHLWSLIEDEVRKAGSFQMQPQGLAMDSPDSPGTLMQADVERRSPVDSSSCEEAMARVLMRLETANEAPWARVATFYSVHRAILLGGAGVLAFVVLWQLGTDLGVIEAMFASSPGAVFMAGRALLADVNVWRQIALTIVEFGIGFGASVVVGVALGIVMGWYEPLLEVLDPFVSAMYATPRIALLPLIVLWAGIGSEARILLVFSIAVLPIIVNTVTGVRAVDRTLIRVGRVFGAGDLDLFRTVTLPASVPYIVAGLRIGVGQGMIGVIAAEFFIGTEGLGGLLNFYGASFQTARLIFVVVVTAALGIVVVALLSKLESQFESWRPRLQES